MLLVMQQKENVQKCVHSHTPLSLDTEGWAFTPIAEL